MIARAVMVPVPDAHLLFAMPRADARIHIEHNASGRMAAMNAAYPLTGKTGERGKVLFGTEPARFETPHLACRCRASRGRFSAGNPTHRRIMAKTSGVVHILLLAPPGVGITFYMGSIARAIGTTFIPIAMNSTSDRWRLSGLSSVFKYAKIGKLAKGLLECPTSSPLFAFDELDKAPSISGDNVIDVLLSVLEPVSQPTKLVSPFARSLAALKSGGPIIA